MISPKRIERLWTACHDLRPDELHVSVNGRWSIDADEYSDASTNGVSESIAHALIRDKIVWWLAKRERDCVCSVSPKGKYGIGERIDGNKVLFNMSEVGLYDPTEGCFLAVERVLGLPVWEESK